MLMSASGRHQYFLSLRLLLILTLPQFIVFFFLNDPAPPEIYPLPLHAALPICAPGDRGGRPADFLGRTVRATRVRPGPVTPLFDGQHAGRGGARVPCPPHAGRAHQPLCRRTAEDRRQGQGVRAARGRVPARAARGPGAADSRRLRAGADPVDRLDAPWWRVPAAGSSLLRRARRTRPVPRSYAEGPGRAPSQLQVSHRAVRTKGRWPAPWPGARSSRRRLDQHRKPHGLPGRPAGDGRSSDGAARHARPRPAPDPRRRLLQPALSMDLKNRVAIVTGGARGIGLAIVEDLRCHGANVVIVDAGVSISGEPLEPRIAEQVAARIEGTAAVCGDIAQSETAQQAVRLAQERFGGVDILVNNAAIIRDAFIFKAEPAASDAVLRTNLTGAYRLFAAARPVMREQAKAGRAPRSIVNIGSTAR